MANPQIEDGYLQIAMELVEQFQKCRFSGQEWQIIWTTLRKTWGWKKKMDRVSLSQYAEATKIDRRKCHSLLKGLTERKVILRVVIYMGDRKHISYGFNKDYNEWILSPKRMTVIQKDDRVSSKKVSKVSSKRVNTKDSKDTIIKEITPLPLWLDENVWKDYILHRKGFKQKMTLKAEELAIKKLERLKTEGNDPTEVINQSIEMGWKGLFEIKDKREVDNGDEGVRGKHDNIFWEAMEARDREKNRPRSD